MPKSRRRKHKPAKRRPKQQPQEQPRRRWFLPSLSRGWKIFGGVVLLLSAVALFLQLAPRVTVSPAPSLDPSKPFNNPFVISNEGYLPIYDVTFRCRIREVRDEGNARIIAPRGTSDMSVRPTLRVTEKSTIVCPFPFNFEHPLVGADIEIIVEYRPAFLFWRSEQSFRFGTAKNAEGNLIWFSRSVSE